jgi:hypothetical protein
MGGAEERHGGIKKGEFQFKYGVPNTASHCYIDAKQISKIQSSTELTNWKRQSWMSSEARANGDLIQKRKTPGPALESGSLNKWGNH